VTDLQQQQQQGWGGSVAPLPLHNVRQLRELLYAYKVRPKGHLSSVVLSDLFACQSQCTSCHAMPSWPAP
jgi:hypothetical protein